MTTTTPTAIPAPLRPSTPAKRAHAKRRTVVRWTKRVALGLAAVGALGVGIYAWLPSPVVVEVATAHRGTLEVEVDEDGTTRVHDRFVVAAPISGTLERIDLEAGATVARSAPLARILPPSPALLNPRSRDEATARLASALARQHQAEIAIPRATATRDEAIRQADRGRQLAARGAITASEREQLELAEQLAIADRVNADAARATAIAEVATARATLGVGRDPGARDAITVTSPIDGRVLRVVRDSAGPIVAGAPLLELGDPGALEVTVDVLSSDAARIEPDMAAELDGWGGALPLRGHVRLVEPSGFTRISALGVEEQRVHVEVSLDTTPPTLGDGFRVEARIVTWRGEALVVPASAVFRDRERWSVYTAEAGHARLVRVELGHRGRLDVEITSGLSDGATVVLHPGDRVRDGVAVSVRP